MKISYKSGYKYQLLDDVSLDTGVTGFVHYGPLLEFQPTGILRILAGYAWDGPSGLTIDTEDFMGGSLIHDGMYQLMREGVLDWRIHRLIADLMLRNICMEDGMLLARALYVFRGVRVCGEMSAMPESARPLEPVWPEGSS